MAWIAIEQFRLDFAAAKRATDSQIQMALDAAEDELAELVGSDAAADAKLDAPTDSVRGQKLIRGHTFLAIATFLLNVRNVKREQDAASPSTVQTISNEYWTPKEIAEMAAQWRAMAMRALSSYLIVEVDDDAYGSAVEYVHPEPTSICGCT